jgi:SAM-dependent methyltransferase
MSASPAHGTEAAPDLFRQRLRHYVPARIAPYAEATRAFPSARERERGLLIERLAPRPGATVVDAMSGSGYLAEGLRRRLGPDATIVCIDPAPAFTETIDPSFLRATAQIDALPLASGSVAAVANLAGTHHLAHEQLQAFFAEAFRVLEAGGRFAMADVQRDTPAARWLNGPVDRFSDIGHAGRFPAPGALAQELRATGFTEIEEKLEVYSWDLPDLAALVWFCKRLFRLSRADDVGVREALLDTLPVTQDESGAHLGWSLVHASGVRPH